MSRPEARAAACAGKVRYESAHAAYKQMKIINRRRSRSGGWRLKDTFGACEQAHPYRGNTCHGWHIGAGQ